MVELLTIGEVERRTGVSASALRFYERAGLLTTTRSPSGQRRFHRDALRRVGFIRIAQRVGLTLEQIREALTLVPADRAPTAAEWARLSKAWQPMIDERIVLLGRLRDQLSSCIGCGCLSLKACALYNPDDAVAERGAGPRYLIEGPPA